MTLFPTPNGDSGEDKIITSEFKLNNLCSATRRAAAILEWRIAHFPHIYVDAVNLIECAMNCSYNPHAKFL